MVKGLSPANIPLEPNPVLPVVAVSGTGGWEAEVRHLLCVRLLRARKKDIAVHVVEGARQWQHYRLIGFRDRRRLQEYSLARLYPSPKCLDSASSTGEDVALQFAE